MSGAKYIKQAIIASLCEHPEADKYRQRAFSADNIDKVMEAMAQQLQTLTKADFLSPDDEGKYIIDSPGAWRNFAKIAKIIQDNGDKLTYDDFMKPLGGDTQKTLLESAWTQGGLGKVFAFDVWQSRYEEMERLWYKVPVPHRKDLFHNDGLVSQELKRKMFAAAGRTTPEDRLAKAGLTPADVRDAICGRNAGLEDLAARLQRAGERFCKEYVLQVDSYGDTVFAAAQAWDKYDAVTRMLKEGGERFEAADLTKQVSFAKNILSRAAEHKTLDKVFTPAHWQGRLPEMLNLWSYVLDGWKMSPMTTQDFDGAYAQAESLTYAPRFQERSAASKADLLRPLNPAAEGEKPVLPLGLREVWDRFDAVAAQLEKWGERLTIADLRAPTGQMGNSCLMCAVKFGRFDKVTEIARQSGEPLTLDDFLAKDAQGNTLINVLAEKNQLAQAFAPEVWAGRVNDMKALWAQVSVSQRHQVDFPQAEIRARQATLKQKKGGIKLQSGNKAAKQG